MVAPGERPSSPPDPPKRHGGVASGQSRRSCARSVHEPSISLACGATGNAQMCWYDAIFAVATRHCCGSTSCRGHVSDGRRRTLIPNCG